MSCVGSEPGDRRMDVVLTAVRSGDVGTLQQLLLLGDGDTDISTEIQDLALREAVRCQHVAVVQLLLDRCTDVLLTPQYLCNLAVDAAKIFNSATRPAPSEAEGLKGVVCCLLDRVITMPVPDEVAYDLLHAAAMYGTIRHVRQLVNRNVCVEQWIKYKYSPVLHLAAARGDLAIVTLLLNRGALVNAIIRLGGLIPLLEAAKGGHLSVVQLLLDRGAHVNACNESEMTALLFAARGGHLEMVRLLLDRGASISDSSRSGGSALFEAIKSNAASVVQLLLDRGADIHQRGSLHCSPFSWAARAGNLAAMEMLLDRGANINAIDNCGQSAVMHATSHGNVPMMQFLLDRGVKLTSGGVQEVRNAISGGHLPMIHFLLDQEINIQASNVDASFYNAAGSGHFAMVQWLLEQGYVRNINYSGFTNTTALAEAVRRGHLSVAQLLLDKGADINGSMAAPATLLSEAAHGGHVSVVRMLIDRGINVDGLDWALFRAACRRHAPAVQLLLDLGADVNFTDEDGRTPLHAALCYFHSPAAQILVERCASSLTNSNLRSFVALARRKYRLDTVGDLMWARRRSMLMLSHAVAAQSSNSGNISRYEQGGQAMYEAMRSRDIVRSVAMYL